MNPKQTRSRVPMQVTLMAVVCALLILPGNTGLWALPAPQDDSIGQQARIPNDQLDSLVAPIALYPDPLLSQTLVAATYPLEIVQLQQFLDKNKGLKDKALTDAVMKQNWDPSVQAMAVFPDIVKQMADNIGWTSDLGNAFLAQQNDVMASVQRLRSQAMAKGALKTSEQQKVETQVVEGQTVVVVQPASPEVVYVPSYNPAAIWGAPPYPYPPMAYPTGGRLLAFGAGMAIGAAWGNGGWGWNTGWGGGNNNININRNNNFVNSYNSQRVNAGNRYGGTNNNWQHNPQHRGGAPYGNQATAQRYGGTSRAGQGQAQGRGQAQGQGQFGGRQQAGAGQQPAGGRQQPGAGSGFAQGGGRGSEQGLNRGAGGGGGDRVGNRQVSSGSMGSRDSGAFSGASSRSAASASSSRGSSSMGSRGGGGGGGGGGRGGGGGGRGGGRR